MERKKKKKKMSEVQLGFKPFIKQVKIILTVLRIKKFHLLLIKALLY